MYFVVLANIRGPKSFSQLLSSPIDKILEIVCFSPLQYHFSSFFYLSSWWQGGLLSRNNGSQSYFTAGRTFFCITNATHKPIQSHLRIQLTAEMMAACQDENHSINHFTISTSGTIWSFSYTISCYLPYMSNWALGKCLLSDYRGRIAEKKQQKEDSNHYWLPRPAPTNSQGSTPCLIGFALTNKSTTRHERLGNNLV